jgi:hypothetical protein
MQRELEAQGILNDEYGDGDKIIVDVVNERLSVQQRGGSVSLDPVEGLKGKTRCLQLNNVMN